MTENDDRRRRPRPPGSRGPRRPGGPGRSGPPNRGPRGDRRHRGDRPPPRSYDPPAPKPPAAPLVAVDEVEVEIEQLVAGGQGLGRYEGVPLFVPRTAPGDRVRVRLTDKRPDYGRGEVIEILRPGPGRREPPCPYFEHCGGCDLQHLEDDLQPRLKADAAVESLRRLGGIELETPPKIIAGEPWGYRLRTQLHIETPTPPEPVVEGEAAARTDGDTTTDSDGETGAVTDTDTGAGAATEPREAPVVDPGTQPFVPATSLGRVRVGYHRRGSNELVAVDRCPILVPALESLLPRLPGHLADIAGEPPKRLDLAVGAAGALSTAPVVEGLPHGEVGRKVGPDRDELRYDARVFFQAHQGLLDRLVAEVVGDWTGGTAYDLFAGVGLFTLALARRYESVTAVEGDRIAARFNRRNARRARLDHVETVHQRLESWIHNLDKDADRVLLDPPRGGLHRRVRDFLFEFPPKRLTYVSCHAATLARDLRILTRRLDIESVTLFDLFPQTGHMETVVQLVRSS